MKNIRTKSFYAFTLVVFFYFGMTGIVNADSLYFNGVDSWVEIADSQRLSGGPGRSLTVEAWIYPTALPADFGKHIVAKYKDYNNKDWGLLVDKDGLVGFQKETWSLPGCQRGNWLVWSSEAIQGNEWSHIAFVFDNDNDIVKVYINGVLQVSRALPNCDLPDTNAVVWIGGPGPFYYSINQLGIFDGCIDEVRIWDIARTDDEISDNMPVGRITGTETGLAAFFDFSPRVDPTVLYDLSGNSNDGEVFGASWDSVCPNYRDAVIGDGPFAYYRLGESAVTDTVIDEMGNHPGSFQNNPTVGVSGALLTDPANTAMCFDSSQSQYIELTTLGDYGSRTTEGFSVEYWLKTDDPNNYQTILGTVNSPTFITDFLVDIAYGGEIGRLRLYFRDDHWCRYNVDFYPDGTNFNIYDNQWHHIVHVYNPAESALEDQMTLYIDGKRQEVEVWLGDCVPYDSSDFNEPMTLGALNLRGSIRSHLNGCLDEVAFYTRPLTEDEVLSHYLASICKPKIIWDPDTIETVLTPTGTDTWESNQLWYPRVMYEGGEYKMWYAGTLGYSYVGNSGIGYATSLDGVDWANRQRVHGPATQPSFERSDSPFVIKEGDTYRMWHRDYYEPACGEWSGYASHMTSTDGTNWNNHDPVLSAQGISGPQQDGYNIKGVSVLKEESQYVMWYAVHDCPSPAPHYRPKIWRATSTDGIIWIDRQLSLPYIPDTWENSVYDPHVVSDHCGGYVMYYTAYSDETGQQLAVATSTDGITWTNRQQIGVAGRAPFYFEDVDGTPYLYFSRGDGYNEGYEIARMRGTRVVENQPPVAICQDVTVPTEPGTCTATAMVDAGSYDPDGDPITMQQAPAGPYSLGTNNVTLTVTDDKGASDTCSATVTVEDQEPPTIQNIMASPDTLWPPNHKMKPVSVIVSVSDNCDQDLDIVLTSVVCDEPDDALDVGDGHTTDDIQDADIGAEDYAISLRAERQGEGDGRIYTITYTATDDSGNSTTADTVVRVPYELE